MDAAAAQVLRQRILAQGWDQGCHLTVRSDLFLADLQVPITAEACKEAERSGAAPRGVVLADFELEHSPGMIIVSQLCDLVADVDLEPMCEAIPLYRLDPEDSLPKPNSARRFLVNADERLIADQTRRLMFEKTLLPDRAANQLLTETQRQTFRAWCARRASRVPFPDDFVETIGEALSRALRSALGRRPELAATFTWRVLQRVTSAGIDVAFVVPYDETHPDADGVPGYLSEVLERVQDHLPAAHTRARERLPSVREHTLARIEPKPASDISLRSLLTYPPLNLEHLTYQGGEITGVEPQEEHLP